MDKTKKCPKCSGEMKWGLMMTPGAVVGVRWHEGEPSKLLNILNRLPRISAYKCSSCGYIENYVEG